MIGVLAVTVVVLGLYSIATTLIIINHEKNKSLPVGSLESDSLSERLGKGTT
jgi:hypothetical protein